MSEKKVSLLKKKKNRTPAIVSHMAAIRKKVVLEVLDGFLLSDDVPFSRNMPFRGSFLSTPRSTIPFENTDSRLFSRTVVHVFIESDILGRKESVSWLVPRGTLHKHASHWQHDA